VYVNEDQDSSKTDKQPPELPFDVSRIFTVRSMLYFTIVNCSLAGIKLSNYQHCLAYSWS